MAGRRASEPDPAALELAARIYEAGRRHSGIPQDCQFPETKYQDPDSLADAIIDLGCREIQAQDMQQHSNRLAKGSVGSQAQSVMERVHQDPEPPAARLVRQRVHADWMLNDERLNRLADRVLAIAAEVDRSAAGAGAPAAAAQDPEAAALHALDVARRRLAAAEGNHIAAGGDAAEVDAAFDTFQPPIRRHALAEIVVRRLSVSKGGSSAGGAKPTGPAGAASGQPGVAAEM